MIKIDNKKLIIEGTTPELLTDFTLIFTHLIKLEILNTETLKDVTKIMGEELKNQELY